MTQPSSSGRVFFTAERVSANTIRLALDNGASSAIGYNLCSSELQQRDGSTWTRVPVDEVCTLELRSLNPGHDATFEKQLPAGVSGRELRYMTRIENPLGSAPAPIFTDSFR